MAPAREKEQFVAKDRRRMRVNSGYPAAEMRSTSTNLGRLLLD
jgi:hypothetical protein